MSGHSNTVHPGNTLRNHLSFGNEQSSSQMNGLLSWWFLVFTVTTRIFCGSHSRVQSRVTIDVYVLFMGIHIPDKSSLNEESLWNNLQAFSIPQAGVESRRSKLSKIRHATFWIPEDYIFFDNGDTPKRDTSNQGGVILQIVPLLINTLEAWHPKKGRKRSLNQEKQRWKLSLHI
jgi:hypothetical protein